MSGQVPPWISSKNGKTNTIQNPKWKPSSRTQRMAWQRAAPPQRLSRYISWACSASFMQSSLPMLEPVSTLEMEGSVIRHSFPVYFLTWYFYSDLFTSLGARPSLHQTPSTDSASPIMYPSCQKGLPFDPGHSQGHRGLPGRTDGSGQRSGHHNGWGGFSSLSLPLFLMKRLCVGRRYNMWAIFVCNFWGQEVKREL